MIPRCAIYLLAGQRCVHVCAAIQQLNSTSYATEMLKAVDRAAEKHVKHAHTTSTSTFHSTKALFVTGSTSFARAGSETDCAPRRGAAVGRASAAASAADSAADPLPSPVSCARFDSVLCAPLAGCGFYAMAWLAFAAASGTKASCAMSLPLLLLLSGPVGFVRMAEGAALDNAGGVPTIAHATDHAPPGRATTHATSMAPPANGTEVQAPSSTVTTTVLEAVDAPPWDALMSSSHVTRRLVQINLSPGANLQAEVASANPGDELILADGNYTGSSTYPAGPTMLSIDKDITIRALNPGQAVLDGQDARRVIHVASGTIVLHGLVITRGSALGWGGGGLVIYGGVVTVEQTTISGNTVGNAGEKGGGGMHIYDGTVSVVSSQINNNKADSGGCGGGAYIGDGTVTFDLVTISGNTATGNMGGGMCIYGGVVTVERTTISGNTAHVDGGGIAINGGGSGGGTVSVVSSQINSNTASTGFGGGIAIENSRLSVVSSQINDNQADNKGGGIHSSREGKVSVVSSQINNNQVSIGSNLYGGAFGTQFPGDGGGAYIGSGDCTFNSVDISGNFALNGGGMFSNGGMVTVEQTTISGNTALIGAGITKVGGYLYLTATTFAGNTGWGSTQTSEYPNIGGNNKGLAIAWTSNYDSLLINCTFRDHTSSGRSTGAAMIYQQTQLKWSCPLGKWSPRTGDIPVMNFTGCAYGCPAGTIGTATDLTSADDCDPCPVGKYCPSLGMGEGIDCPAGKRAPGVGAQACLDCGPGEANDLLGQASCTPCATGSATALLGSTECTECAQGEYAGGIGTVACTACPAFSTTAAAGAMSVDECECLAGFFLLTEGGVSSCQECSNVLDFSTALPGTASADDCVCERGYFLEANATQRRCVACDPALMDCSVEGITVANMPIKRGGWRLSNSSSTVYTCFNKAACVGAGRPLANTTTSGRRLGAILDVSTAGDALCAPGHTGFLCGTCLDQWYGYKDDALCTKCEGNIAQGFAPLIVAIAVLALAVPVRIVIKRRGRSLSGAFAKVSEKSDLARRQSRTKSKKAALVLESAQPKIKILVSLYQIIGDLGAIFAIPFPNVYERIVSVVSGIVSIELPTLMPVGCFFPTNYNTMLMLKTLWPLAAYAILFLLSCSFAMAQKDRLADSCIDYLFLVMVRAAPESALNVPPLCVLPTAPTALHNRVQSPPALLAVHCVPGDLERRLLHVLLRAA